MISILYDINPLLEQTPDSHFVLRLCDKGENDFKDNKTIDSVPLLLRLRWHKYQRIIVLRSASKELIKIYIYSHSF